MSVVSVPNIIANIVTNIIQCQFYSRSVHLEHTEEAKMFGELQG